MVVLEDLTLVLVVVVDSLVLVEVQTLQIIQEQVVLV